MIRYVLPVFALLALAGCGGSPPPVQSFPPLDYTYLPPIMLKVSSITVVNQYVPDPGAATLLGEDPEPPATALQDMLNHRLVANGTPGTATVTIEAASIDQVGSNYTGTLTVRLDVQSADGHSTGYTMASVTHSETAPDPDSDQATVQAALYGVTKKLMDAMNVQLQYQIQQNLGSWVAFSANAAVPPLGAAPASGGIAGGIQATPLSAPGAAAATPLTAPATPAVPNTPPSSAAAAAAAGLVAPAAMPPASPAVTPPTSSQSSQMVVPQ
jgi:hypothetical protein